MSEGPIWTRTEPNRRAALTRATIVTAAMRLAEREGIDAVSIRGVAAELDARPMTLHHHLGNKENLLDLMFDELAGRVLEGDPLPGDWRDALGVIAGRKRQLGLAHPWGVALYARRPRIGPHTLALLERSVIALRPVIADVALAVQVVNVVDDYTMGHVTRELTFGVRHGGGEWEKSIRPYLQGLAQSGAYPSLAPLLAQPASDDGDATFIKGLGWVLDGIAKSIGGKGKASRAT